MWFNKARALQEAERSLTQGRLSQAIQQYSEIIENDPSDLALINTAGDLCVRDNSIPEALQLFRKLAEAYTREGFVLRAIAIDKKILKLAPQDVEAMLKLGELYAGQGLAREARDLYAQALTLCQQQNLEQRAIEVMRKMVANEPTNVAQLLHLADCCHALGRTGEALRAYLDASEAALAQGAMEGATAAFGQAAALDSTDARVIEVRRRLFPEAEAPGERPTEGEAAVAAESAPTPEAPDRGATGADAVDVQAQGGEIDLSEELEAWSDAQGAPGAAGTAFDFEESSAEIDFYLDYAMADEARKTLDRLAQQFPGEARVVDLRARYEARVSGAPAAPAANPVRDLAHDLESGWSGPQAAPAKVAPPAALDFAASLSAMLEEAATEAGRPQADDDPQTHYELGVAFREMGLVDEAIGEFQSVVRRASAGVYPPQFLTACSLLALCFSEKQMPGLAAKWYERALEMPGLDPEAALALHYDLGLAQEQAGNLEAAGANFLEVYSHNIDYRDVAEKVRQLSAKP
ncbi:MAG TPA: tetratricopeptide repeat protein [Terriglobia bacterium]|nr:tetratricopeptide repeat protein [Terriglobia bacterium]